MDAAPSGNSLHHIVGRWRHPLSGSVGVLVAYYAVPIRQQGGEWTIGLLITIVAAALIAWAIIGQYRLMVRGEQVANLPTLALLAVLAVSVFSLGFYILQGSRPDEFVGLQTRTDALYFSLSSISTVGYGDVHAAGQAARVMVSVQLVFNLVFLAGLGSIFTDRLRERAASGHTGHVRGSSENGPKNGPKNGPESGREGDPKTSPTN